MLSFAGSSRPAVRCCGGEGYTAPSWTIVGFTIEPGKRGGKPCIRGLRITVYDVLDYLAAGMTEAQIVADFADLQPEDIRACLQFAADRERRLMTSGDSFSAAPTS